MHGAGSPIYRFFRHGNGEAAPVRSVIVALVIAATLITAVCVVRVTNQHEVLRLGYELSRRTEYVRRLHEDRRRLELEHATLTSPDRIRGLAMRLGMTQVSPERVRVVRRRPSTAGASIGRHPELAER
jgi:cell division protein FtsL